MVTFLHPECQLNLMQGLPPESNRSSESASLQEEKLAAVSTDTFNVLTMMEVHSFQDSSCVVLNYNPVHFSKIWRFISNPFSLLI